MRRDLESLMRRGFILFLLFFGVCWQSFAADFSVVTGVTVKSVTGGYEFTVTRGDSKAPTSINYRTLDGSAVGGIHFEHATGILEFETGVSQKTVTVKTLEVTGIDRWSTNSTQREFGFVAWNDFGSKSVTQKISSGNKNFSYSTAEREFKINGTVNLPDNCSKCYKSDNKEVFEINDDGSTKVSQKIQGFTADEDSYLADTKQEWRYLFNISFKFDEYNDGSFALGISNTGFKSSWSSDKHKPTLNGNIAAIGFENDGDFVFPIGEHNKGQINSNITDPAYDSGNYYNVKVKDITTIYTTWDGGGDGEDNGRISNLMCKGKRLDGVNPSLTQVFCNTDFPYSYNDMITIAVKFDEIISCAKNGSNTTTDIKLETNVGTFNYAGGLGTNILYFQGNITATTDVENLLVKSINRPLYDLANNYKNFSSIEKQITDFKYKYSRVEESSLKGTPYVWNKSVKLEWNNIGSTKGKWYIYRYKQGEKNYTHIATTEAPSYEDKNLLYDVEYKYNVRFVPNDWNVLASGKILSFTLARNFAITPSLKVEDNHILLSWECEPSIGDDGKYTFQINRTPSFSKTVTVEATKNQKYYSYKDEDVKSGCETYFYSVQIDGLFADDSTKNGVTYKSGTVNGMLDGNSKVTSVTASKGLYANTVKLSWKAVQVGSDVTYYTVYRREIGVEEDNWVKLYETSGTLSSYSYDDNTAMSGVYYEYKIASSYYCSTVLTEPVEVNDVGFSRSSGVISGRITYGTGTAVEGVKVYASKNNDSEASSQFYSLRVNGAGSGLKLPVDSAKGVKYFTNKPWSIQLYVNPDDSLFTAKSLSEKAMLVDCYRNFGLFLSKADQNRYYVGISGPDGADKTKDVVTKLTIPSRTFSHLTFSYDGDSTFTVRCAESSDSIVSVSAALGQTHFVSDGNAESYSNIYFGAAANGTDHFSGYIDEIRIFSGKELTNDEIGKNYNRTLAGDESNLVMYVPLDEGIASLNMAYDYSKTSGMVNGNHVKILGGTIDNTHIPSDEQLGLYGVTDEYGNYTINGIPFSGDGTTYVITPVLGIHEFSPKYLTRFVSSSSLVHSAVDFEDISSFEVNGVVTYFNTNYPVEGVSFYVDGVVCSKENGVITTGTDGKFTISVPIGDHHITAKKENHVFVNEGRYPKESWKEHTFDQVMNNLQFEDSTFVTLTGRVVGGLPESMKAHGLGQGKATIGKATIKLTGGDSYQFNTDSSVIRTFQCPSEYVSSMATAGLFDKGDDAREITIHTDSATGEFAVSLPPVDYKVKSVKVDNNQEIVFSTENIESILFSSGKMQDHTDTIVNQNGDSITFAYKYALDLIYRSEPVLEFTSLSTDDGAFGDKYYVYKDEATQVNDTIPLYAIDPVTGEISYTFGHPLFTQLNQYTQKMYLYESYVNKDSVEVRVTKFPLSGAEVEVSNSLGATMVAISDGLDMDENEMKDGDILQTGNSALTADSLGMLTYQFQATYPNIVEPYTLGMEINFVYDDKSYSWSGNGKFLGIVTGGLQTGNNFVTGGPDLVSFVLRDPPGSNSSAYIEKGTTITNSHHMSKAFNSENSIITTSHLGTKVKSAAGAGFYLISEVDTKGDLIVGTEINGSYTDANTYTTTTKTTERISTQGAMNYVGADGDVFIGTGTNYIFGKERMIAPQRNADNTYSIGMKEVLGMGQSFTTAFKYSQNYIENILIPNYQDMRNSVFITDVPESQYNASYPNNTDKPIYITMLSKDDERLGSRNTDAAVWGDKISENENDGPSYIMIVPDTVKCYSDTIVWFNSQIDGWIDKLRANEEVKVKAIASGNPIVNHSFDSGSSIEHSVETCNDTVVAHTSHCDAYIVAGTELGFSINEFGVDVAISLKEGYQQDWGKETTNSHCTNVGYSLVEDGDDDALTVDVYDAGDGYGPVFYTRAGQTTCPYEDEKRTKYFEPGDHILSNKTMQIEYPRITVGEGNLETQKVIDIPSGSAANFTLNLDNLSETSENVWYRMYVVDESNPYGAALNIDGVPFSTARSTLVNALETTHKNIQIKQSRPDIMKYDSIAVVLASDCQFDGTDIFDVIADTVYLSVEFVPSCSPVTLLIEERIMNTSTHDTLQLALKDYEKDYLNFSGIKVQYKGEHDNEWNLVRKLDIADLDGARTSISFPMPSSIYNDQTYQFRAVSSCTSGADSEITNESEIIDVVKDMSRPQVLGNPNPADGILDAGDEISVTFNENIRNSVLSNQDNFVVQAILNDDEVAHNVALKMDSTPNFIAETEADILLADKSFAVDMWVNLSSNGYLFNHYSSDESFYAHVSDKGELTIGVDGTTVTSSKTIPFNKWCFLTICYTAGEDSSRISSLVAYDATEAQLFSNKVVPNYHANGKLAIGKNIRGAISEMALWNTNRSNKVAQSEMYFKKAASTENLIGYWKFDEGHGTSANDWARSRNMVLTAESWYLNNQNYAAHLNGSQHISLDVSACNALKNDDYMLEMWFRGNNQSNATLWSADSSVSLKFNEVGYLTLVSDETEVVLSTNDYLDNVWHHVALNVLRNGMTTVYVDGKAEKQISSNQVGALQAQYLSVGAQRYKEGEVYQYTDFFQGDVDEVRYWLATFNGKAIDQFRYMRLNGDEAGLVAYYPFEGTQVDAGQTSYLFDLKDNSLNAVGNAIADSVSQSSTAPALQPKAKMSDLSFGFVASERTISITLNESAKRLEGATVNFTVKNVRDENNNYSLPVTWSAFVNQNRLIWMDDAISLEKNDEEVISYDVTIANQGQSTEAWSISQLPLWLTADKTSGSLSAQKSETIHFEVSDAVAIGKYEEIIYLSGNEGINVPFNLSLKVSKEKPQWMVDPNLYENSMSVIAQLKLDGQYTADKEDLVAAFVNGTCVGVASPSYFSRYDAYFVIMDVYGNTEDLNQKVVFKAWDASTGILYPALSVSESVVMESNQLYGSMAKPIILASADMQEENLSLKAGWNWISMYVEPEDNSVGNLFSDIKKHCDVIKGKNAFAVSSSKNFRGELRSVSIGQMYKINMIEAHDLSLVGKKVNASDTSVTIKPNWNWIGFNSSVNMPLSNAFADLNPVDGDMVKGQSGFAVYENYEWVGTLTALTPGKGYMYKSMSEQTRTFHYPSHVESLRSLIAKETTTETQFDVVDETVYPGNMTLIGKVMDGHVDVKEAQVGVFDEKGVCRGAVSLDEDGLAFLTIAGESAGDSLLFKVIYNGELYTIKQGLAYEDDAALGSIDKAYVIQLVPVDKTDDVLNDHIYVYPTIADVELSVASDFMIKGYSISDLEGRILKSESVEATNLSVNVSDLQQGSYFIQIMTDEGSLMRRFYRK